MNPLAPASTSNLLRGMASFGDVKLASINALAVDAAESLLAVGQYAYPQTGVELLELATRKIRWRSAWGYSSDDAVKGLAFSRDGQRLWIALANGALRCYDVADGTLQKKTKKCPGDFITEVRLARDAQWAVARGGWDQSTGWSGPPVDMNEYFTALLPAEAGDDAPRPDGLADTLLAATPPPHSLLRFRDAATLAYSPDGTRELFSIVKGHEAAPQLLLRARPDKQLLDTLTFHRPGDFALAATFTDDGAKLWLGTESGLLFGYALT
jgi:hypothetical protein